MDYKKLGMVLLILGIVLFGIGMIINYSNFDPNAAGSYAWERSPSDNLKAENREMSAQLILLLGILVAVIGGITKFCAKK
jgi:hypothetical protein